MPSSAATPPTVFLSHATEDDDLVRQLRRQLNLLGAHPWDDNHKLLLGNWLAPTIKQAIEQSTVFCVLLSPAALKSKWVRLETEYALQCARSTKPGTGRRLVVIPILLPGVTLETLPPWVPPDLLGARLDDRVGALSGVVSRLSEALGLQLPDDDAAAPEVADRPQARLLLELRDPSMTGEKEQRHATATAVLRYYAPGRAEPAQSEPYLFAAPLEAVDDREIAWYLERYPQWPGADFRSRAQEVEAALPQWGRELYAALLPQEAQEVFGNWLAVAGEVERVFTVRVEPAAPRAAAPEQRETAAEAASSLLALPWELLHDRNDYLFQGQRAVRVRRQLPQRSAMDPLPGALPVRVLVVSPRPEEEGTGYIDHRVSARPLLDALDELGELAEVTLLEHPTFRALEAELEAAERRNERYHVVHFDGHGVYDQRVGLGALCFEHPDDQQKDEHRRTEIVHAGELARVLRRHRVSLFFLEACQSAQAECDPTASVAGALLQGGVTSVVAMSHSVLVETARRFVEGFYGELVRGTTVGAAMLAGRRALYRDQNRGRAFTGALKLQDWFVPVLYQEESDPRLFAARPSEREREAHGQVDEGRVRGLPDPPLHTFVGRSRELLGVERRLARAKYAVLLAEGGEGKTTLAVEAARWMVRTGRFARAAFVSLENLPDAHAVLVKLAEQLAPGAAAEDDEKWLQVLERELKNAPTLLIIDNVESVLPPPPGSTAAGLHNPDVLEALLAYCGRLAKAGGTHLLFTSREALPAPFDGHTVRLGRLHRTEAVELVGRVLGREGDYTGQTGETESDVEALVETAQCHARALVLLAGEVRRQGLRRANLDLQTMMQELEKRFPEDRERSLLASVRLSLNRLPPETRELIRPLGVFPGGGTLGAIAMVLKLDRSTDAIHRLSQQLVDVGLAEPLPPGFLRFDPGLAPALLLELPPNAHEAARVSWRETMAAEAAAIYELHYQKPGLAATMALWALPGWLDALEGMSGEAPEHIIGTAAYIEMLAHTLGRRQARERAGRVRLAAEKQVTSWGHAAFQAARGTVDQLFAVGRLTEAVQAAGELLRRAEAAGEKAYAEAVYDLAMAHHQLGNALWRAGAPNQALPLLQEAERRFERVESAGREEARRMASVARNDQADCLRALGRYEPAAQLYEACVEEAIARGDLRAAAVSRGQLGTLRMLQERYSEALSSHNESKDIFEQLGEPETVAVCWHQMGMICRRAGNLAEAERAYLESLRIETQLGNRRGEADTLGELGLLYARMGRPQDAITFARRVAEIYHELGDTAGEGKALSNAAKDLIQAGDFSAARQALQRALECKASLGHAAQPWTTFSVLADLERAEGNTGAAVAARQKAIDAYLAYRRDGGESQSPGSQWCTAVVEAIRAGAGDQATAEFRKVLAETELPEWAKFLASKLLLILGGSRDPALAEDPALDNRNAAELLLLLERLAEAGI